ncbi:hypothetical protein DPEC_G00304400 [Dallia pectoralis]|uniref:Uncharacterized protein n=1 Tax=Dallia pectoralis TaxID=75939 RepID=A0ACC2FDH1_DALPE|nr:hypothetical protein DPEC_G00304400 [Dallia pectoralis]
MEDEPKLKGVNSCCVNVRRVSMRRCAAFKVTAVADTEPLGDLALSGLPGVLGVSPSVIDSRLSCPPGRLLFLIKRILTMCKDARRGTDLLFPPVQEARSAASSVSSPRRRRLE